MQADELVSLMIPATWLAMLGIEALGTGGRWPICSDAVSPRSRRG